MKNHNQPPIPFFTLILIAAVPAMLVITLAVVLALL